MLLFQKIKFKNFLSTGHQITEVNFVDSRTTLIKGTNGEGKSSIFSALIFSLYGKSNRKTNKIQLVNSVNKKDCLVEVEFETRGSQYKIVRGISPNIFEIWIDGKLQNQDANSKDQQKFLEENILKMSMKTFNQVVLLGSNNFIPFMQLSAQDRRDLVEELLDIKIFSTMNNILKEKIKNIERKLNENIINKSTIQDKIEMQTEFIKTLTNNSEEIIQNYRNKIDDIENEIDLLNSLNGDMASSINDERVKLDEISFSEKKLKQLSGISGKLEMKTSFLQEEVDFFNKNEICPTCKQNLQVEFRNEKVKYLENELQNLENGFLELQTAIKDEEERENVVKDITSKISKITTKITTNNSQISQYSRQRKSLENEIDELTDKIKNQSVEKKILSKLIKDDNKLDKELLKCKEAIQYFEFSHILMKDNGIKSKIMEKYIPLINQKINTYLQMMDFYINFTLDGEFKETIRTPIHEDFTYSSFSEGEKSRINLSLILCWREIARMKNSVNCNLILFDETLDSSLDQSGISDFLRIINHVIVDANVFVISHRDGFEDNFDKILEVKKVNGFSKIFT